MSNKRKANRPLVQEVTNADLEKMNLKLSARPKQPWSNEETARRWNESEGHYQLVLKCQTCCLEYRLYSLRTRQELMELHKPTHGQNGRSTTAYCPECGTRGRSLILSLNWEEGPIYMQTATNAAQEKGG